MAHNIYGHARWPTLLVSKIYSPTKVDEKRGLRDYNVNSVAAQLKVQSTLDSTVDVTSVPATKKIRICGLTKK